MEMDSSDVLDVLVEERVLEQTEQGTYSLTDDFHDARDRARRRLDDTTDEALTAELASAADEEVVPVLESARARDAGVTATYLATAEFLDGVDDSTTLQVVTLVEQLRTDPPRADGAPEAFLPVSGDSLELLLELHSRAIVYVWKDDCEPCDLMREEFDDIFPEPDDELALLAVNGPDWAELLADEYGVVGAPTTLFVFEGSVDARLQGAHYRGIIDNEIDILRNA